MLQNKNSIDKKKTKLIIVGVIVILLLGLIYIFFNKEKNKEEKYREFNSSISKLTDVYNEKLSEKSNEAINEVVGEVEDNEVVTHADNSTVEIYNKDNNIESLEDRLKEILDCINNQEYEKFFNMLNKEFISDFSYNLNEFSAKYSFIGGAIGEITNIYTDYDNIIFTVRFTEKETGYISIIDFTVFEDNTLADIAVYTVSNIKKDKTIEDVNYKINRVYQNDLNSYYIIDINNKSQYLLNIKDMLIKNNNTICSYEYIGNYDDMVVYPGIPVKFVIKLYNTGAITDLTLQCIDIDGNRKDIEIYRD